MNLGEVLMHWRPSDVRKLRSYLNDKSNQRLFESDLGIVVGSLAKDNLDAWETAFTYGAQIRDVWGLDRPISFSLADEKTVLWLAFVFGFCRLPFETFYKVRLNADQILKDFVTNEPVEEVVPRKPNRLMWRSMPEGQIGKFGAGFLEKVEDISQKIQRKRLAAGSDDLVQIPKNYTISVGAPKQLSKKHVSAQLLHKIQN